MKENIIKKYKRLLSEAKEDLSTPGKRHKQIPNILTASRLFAPLFIIPTVIAGNFVMTGVMAVLFGLTDMFDGIVARKLNVQSELGGLLDAVTDKVFVGSLLFASSICNPYLLLNIGLELAIAGINVKQELKGGNPKSSTIGKFKTWALFGLSTVGILAPVLTQLSGLIPALAVGTTLLQCMTIRSYLRTYRTGESGLPQSEGTIIEEESLDLDEDTDKEKVLTMEISASRMDTTLAQDSIEKRIEDLKRTREVLIGDCANKDAKEVDKVLKMTEHKK